jgi:hypothetical protein
LKSPLKAYTTPAQNDRIIMIVGKNFVNCIAFPFIDFR